MQSTTIRVPISLRDRLQKRARAEGVTLAGVIERALDASDERHFWAAVKREHEALSKQERSDHLRSGGLDDLSNVSDDQLSERDEW